MTRGTKPTRQQAFAALSEFEAPICDLHVEARTLSTVWDAIGDSRPDQSVTIDADEHEQMTYIVGTIEVQLRQLKAKLYAAFAIEDEKR